MMVYPKFRSAPQNGKNHESYGWSWVLGRVLAKKRSAFLLLFTTAFVYAVGIAFPIFTQKAVDAISNTAGLKVPLLFLCGALAALILEAVLANWRQRFLIDIGTFIDRQMANSFYLSLLRQRTDRRPMHEGNITNAFQQLRPIRNFVLSFVPQVVFEIGSALAAFVVIAVYSIPIACAVLVLTSVFAWAMRNQMAAIGDASKQQFKIDGERQTILTETYPALSTVKSPAVEGRLMRRWQQTTSRYSGIVARLYQIIQRFSNAGLVSSRATSLAIIAVGCVQMSSSTLTLGELIAIQLLVGRATGPIFSLGNTTRQWKDANIALEAFSNYLAEEREEPSLPSGIRELNGRKVAFKNVSLTYPGKLQPALCGVDFETPEKGLVAIVGRNGAGKSTLVKALMGLQRDYEGTVTVGGEEVRNYRPRVLRDRIGIVHQDTVLFTGTIRSNLDVGLSAKSDEVMWQALEFANARNLVLSLPAGLDSPVTEHPRNLSGGQRQRIAVARAVIGNPEILVLDEPTAFLDAEAAVALERKVLQLSSEKLIILVSHNLSAIQQASLIVVLDDGRVVGTGTHEDLMSGSAVYKKLWNDHVSQRAA